MTTELAILLSTALTAGIVHTALGPDHYVPFIALSTSRGWSRAKTLFIVLLCGLGHVLSSIIIAFAGLALGKSIFSIEWLERFRGDIAAWMLLFLGFTYMIYGIFRAIKDAPHDHPHVHDGGIAHAHEHRHQSAHSHPHEKNNALVAWSLFIVFVFGPCEALIPLVLYPAAQGHVFNAVITSFVFSLATITTMTAIIFASITGLSRIKSGSNSISRYSHAMAGLIILIAGIGVKFLGL
jgi:ABC-type nickel/cobalt efflux system permease component RcnA